MTIKRRTADEPDLPERSDPMPIERRTVTEGVELREEGDTLTARFRDAAGNHLLSGRPGYCVPQIHQRGPVTPRWKHPLTDDAGAQQQWVNVITSLRTEFADNGLPNRPEQTAACELMARIHPEELHLVDMHQVLAAARLLTPKARKARKARSQHRRRRCRGRPSHPPAGAYQPSL